MKKFQNLIDKCRKIAASYHQSNILSDLLKSKQALLGLKSNEIIQDVPTRWNSTYLMMQRILEQVDAINEVFGDKSFRKKYDHLLIGDDELAMLKDSKDIFQYFYQATTELSGSKYATISIIMPTFNCL